MKKNNYYSNVSKNHIEVITFSYFISSFYESSVNVDLTTEVTVNLFQRKGTCRIRLITAE